MTEPVVITGLGVVSPLGLSIEQLASRFCAGHTAVGPLAGMGIDGAYGAQVSEIPLEVIPTPARQRVGRLDRLCRLVLSAASLAVESSGLKTPAADAERFGLSFGSGLGCLLTDAEYNQKVLEHGPAAASPQLFAYTVSSAAAGEVSIAFGIKGPNLTVHMGFAAGLGAIGYGFDLIRMGKADVVLAGGADALGPPLVRGLADMRLLKAVEPGRPAAVPFRDAIPGVYPSEGAAVVVLERRDHAQQRGARCWARVEGYAAGFEPSLTRHAREATAVATTLRRSLAASARHPAAVDLVLASAHATELDAIECQALASVFEGTTSPLLFIGKNAWGECFGADGALSVVLAAALLQKPAPALAEHVAHELRGSGVAAAGDATARLQQARLAMVHSLCYSGPTVALVLAQEE